MQNQMGSVFFGLVITVIGSSAANTYYVDATGGNDGNNGTASLNGRKSCGDRIPAGIYILESPRKSAGFNDAQVTRSIVLSK
jgi:hypothetical protein